VAALGAQRGWRRHHAALLRNGCRRSDSEFAFARMVYSAKDPTTAGDARLDHRLSGGRTTIWCKASTGCRGSTAHQSRSSCLLDARLFEYPYIYSVEPDLVIHRCRNPALREYCARRNVHGGRLPRETLNGNHLCNRSARLAGPDRRSGVGAPRSFIMSSTFRTRCKFPAEAIRMVGQHLGEGRFVPK